MTATTIATGRRSADAGRIRPSREAGEKGKWLRFVIILAITALLLVPVGVVVLLAFAPNANSAPGAVVTLDNLVLVLTRTLSLTWLQNSLMVTLATALVATLVAAPAGYVVSRGRGRAVGAYSLTLFIIQSLPVIASVIPLFVLFANFGLVDNLLGIFIIYLGSTVTVSTWMMAAYMDTVPEMLEEAAWIDGCSRFSGFVRVVLRNSLPGILSVAIFSFLTAWNDYLVALAFLRSDTNFTLPVGMQSFFQQNVTDWGSVMAVALLMMVPPVLIFIVLNKYFSIGGIAGSLAGR